MATAGYENVAIYECRVFRAHPIHAFEDSLRSECEMELIKFGVQREMYPPGYLPYPIVFSGDGVDSGSGDW